MDLFLIRALFVLVTALSCYELQPLGLNRLPAAGLGVLFGAAVVLLGNRDADAIALPRKFFLAGN